jgi:hypothetical protein
MMGIEVHILLSYPREQESQQEKPAFCWAAGDATLNGFLEMSPRGLSKFDFAASGGTVGESGITPPSAAGGISSPNVRDQGHLPAEETSTNRTDEIGG